LEVPGNLRRVADDAAARGAGAVTVHRGRGPELRALLAPGHQAAPPRGAPPFEEMDVEFRKLFPRDAASRGPAAARRLATGWPIISPTNALACSSRPRSIPVW